MGQKPQNRRETGSRYEQEAAEYLRGQGYEIVECNFRDRFGEIDLVAREGVYLVFVEVKYRRDIKSGYPEEAVSARKQQKIRRTASWYLYRRGYKQDVPCRFDVVSIVGEEIFLMRDVF